ncbi:hypothetical protein ASD15_18680 [Massilia sp. Root351]|uniref:DUF4350 domain-containing protein n=1 Tax=Massilia sp. Root351 TaxID=1736522 RepID=UPI0007089975|nr:DUF4350 domain-containing protein [Massilia sp. Root351]KQV79359.1 hypothetical protein ASD15_18680 [Massilia sp. Root351]
MSTAKTAVPRRPGRGARTLLALACVGALAGSVWLWYAVMEHSPTAVPYVSPLAINNPMLAAGTLLTQHGYSVEVEQRLSGVSLSRLPAGTLILADNGGQVDPVQAAQLMDWARRGNTVVLQPKWVPVQYRAEDNARRPDSGKRLSPLTEPDPLGARFGVGLSYRNKLRANCDTVNGAAEALPPEDGEDVPDEDEQAGEEAGDQASGADGAHAGDDENTATDKPKDLRQLTCVTLPGGQYPLALDTGTEVLHTLREVHQPLWSDFDGMSVRAYREGRGHVVMVSDNYFNNQRLPRLDHAELLLGVAGLNQQGRNVMLVLHADAAPWYAMLWRAAWMPLTALAVLLALLLWRAGRRFGPLLPQPSGERRSLLEHIEASGNWLWRAKGGRGVLLAAARQETEALLRRRAPELLQLGDDEKAARLARLCNTQQIDMRGALYGPAASHPAAFTRQIQLLQQVRIHYERQ